MYRESFQYFRFAQGQHLTLLEASHPDLWEEVELGRKAREWILRDGRS